MADKVSCVVIARTKLKHLILLNRVAEPKGLCLPGGKVEKGESLQDCAKREFFEETGVDISDKPITFLKEDVSADGSKVNVFILTEYLEFNLAKISPEHDAVICVPDSYLPYLNWADNTYNFLFE